MRLPAFVALLATLAATSPAGEDLEKKNKPCCCLRQASSEECRADREGCTRNYLQKLDFYHTKPVLNGPSSTWSYYAVPESFQADDGKLTFDCHGGIVDSSVYTAWVGPAPQPYLDNAKFLIFADEPVDVPKMGNLVVEFEGSGETFKGDQNSYPKQSTQHNDIRFANVGFVTRDNTTGLQFDWVLTNDRVYVVYSRSPHGLGNAFQPAGFTFAIPVKMRRPNDWHSMKTILHGGTKQVSYRLDGHEVFRINRVGYLLDRQYLLIDYSGQEAAVFPASVQYGFGTFTLVNAYPACKRSDVCCDCKYPTLRQALANTGTYLNDEPVPWNPLLGYGSPAVFFQPNDDPALAQQGDFIWGQGSKLFIKKLLVYQEICPRKC